MALVCAIAAACVPAVPFSVPCPRPTAACCCLQLLVSLKVEFTDGGAGMVRNRREDQSLFAADLAKLTEGLEQVEAVQADILLQLWLHPSGSSSGGGDGSHQDQQSAVSSSDRGEHLRGFLQHLIDRNHGAMRHIPPPGLSDQTTLVSAAFDLLRLMNEQVGTGLLCCVVRAGGRPGNSTQSSGLPCHLLLLDASACADPCLAVPATSGVLLQVSAGLPAVPSVQWDPAASFLQGTPPRGGDDPYYDAGRLGGTLSHLIREHPPTGAALLCPAPVWAATCFRCLQCESAVSLCMLDSKPSSLEQPPSWSRLFLL